MSLSTNRTQNRNGLYKLIKLKYFVLSNVCNKWFLHALALYGTHKPFPPCGKQVSDFYKQTGLCDIVEVASSTVVN